MCAPADPLSSALQRNDPVTKALGINGKLNQLSTKLDPIGSFVNKRDPIARSFQSDQGSTKPRSNLAITPKP